MTPNEHSQTVQRRTLGAIMSMGVREFAVKALAFGGWIVLSRLLDPATFGIFAIASFALNLFILLSEVGLGASLVRQPEITTQDLSALFTYQLAWSVPLALLAVAVSFFINGDAVAPAIQALAISFLLISLRTTPSIIAQRKLTYTPIVLSDVTSQLAYWLIAIGAAFAGWGIWSVLASALAFSLINTAVLYARVGWLPSLNFDWRAIHKSAVFSLAYQSQQGASIAKYAMLPILGGLVAGGAGVGYITWAHQIAVIPIQLTQLISRVSFPALSRLQHDPAAFASTLRSILKWTCIITFPVCAILIGLGRQITEYIYDPKWLPALTPLYIFTLNTAINAPVGILLPALYSLGRGGKAFRLLVIMLASTWVAGIALTFAGVGLSASAIAFLIGMIASLFIVAYDLQDFGGYSLLISLIRPASVGLIVAAFLLLLAPVLVHNLISLLAVGALAGLLMLALNLWGDYASLLAQARSFLNRTPKPTLPDDPQDAGIGTR
ncbi:MAG: oligosaccharide flippase family protein [Chloroflexia bacterium]